VKDEWKVFVVKGYSLIKQKYLSLSLSAGQSNNNCCCVKNDSSNMDYHHHHLYRFKKNNWIVNKVTKKSQSVCERK